LNRLLARLGEFNGIRVIITFVKEADGPAWTLNHNGWSDPGVIFIQVNAASSSIKLEQLEIAVTGQKKG
jgi:hypothetical protein